MKSVRMKVESIEKGQPNRKDPWILLDKDQLGVNRQRLNTNNNNHRIIISIIATNASFMKSRYSLHVEATLLKILFTKKKKQNIAHRGRYA